MKLAARIVATLFMAGSATVFFTPAAHADTGQTVTPTVEAWYQPNPTCATSVGCLSTGSVPVTLPVAIPYSPYPSGTLEVGYSAGAETARTYLALPFGTISGTLTSATLTIPLDTAAADGSLLPDTAAAQACLYSGTITAVDGSTETPPPASCGTTVPLKYVATPSPHFTADLMKLSSGLLTTDGLVILPDATESSTAAWRFAFSAHDRTDSAKTAPASVDLTLASGQAVTEPLDDTPVDVPTAVPNAPATIQQPSLSGLSPITPINQPATSGIAPAVVPPVTGAAPVTAPAPQQNVVPTASASTETFGYAYPVVLLLPLALLVVIPAVARALTRDLTPPDDDLT